MSPERVSVGEDGEGHSTLMDRKQKRRGNQHRRVGCEEPGGCDQIGDYLIPRLFEYIYIYGLRSNHWQPDAICRWVMIGVVICSLDWLDCDASFVCVCVCVCVCVRERERVCVCVCFFSFFFLFLLLLCLHMRCLGCLPVTRKANSSGVALSFPLLGIAETVDKSMTNFLMLVAAPLVIPIVSRPNNLNDNNNNDNQ